ncbi:MULTISPECIES: amylo-alpha-1,6-glucosidase [Catenuloplanes]|uniref:Mannosylglycerate hydrolase MGH1-like glycoside hydrolase domain-containing protein n=1 Tax=Catenuloplanes niger TaxID=587534 RepID=A0AAE3ZQF6_9ACTN|nr:hypothetical protein [Catenuloplanes niger]MDR7322328.1 hypothetical protein [Catenuloplanes niger]
MAALRARAVQVLDLNWAGDHTVPARSLYPHQWSWDSAFTAIGLAHVRPDRAWRELHTLFRAQWADGRVPHIVFNPEVPAENYFPGPGFWDAPATPHLPPRSTTGLVQPPVHALAVHEVFRRTGDRGRLAWFYPRLCAQQDYLAARRDAGADGLVSITHPWESGLDNSPGWDTAMARVPADPELLRVHRRRDNVVAAPAHRPTDEDYSRFLAIAGAYRDRGYDDTDLVGRHPFVMECPSFNALYALAESTLAEIAAELGRPGAHHRERARAVVTAMVAHLHDRRTGMFHARDVLSGERSPARCVNGLVPLVLPGLPDEVVTSLIEVATSPRFGLGGPLPVTSYDRTAADFDAVRYWRGPIWINMNWLLRRGLIGHGRAALAAVLRDRTLGLIDAGGSFEYYDPRTGAGLGAPEFSWTAALALDLLSDPLD